jgi:hypothetical protein
LVSATARLEQEMATLTDKQAQLLLDKMSQKYLGEASYPGRAPEDERVILRFKPERVATYNLD